MSSQHGGGYQVRANWTPEWHRLFVDICLKQVKKGNRPRTHLNKQGWKEFCQEFSKKTGVAYDKTQLKNHWDSTKDSWKVWHKLVFSLGAGWDPITQKMNAGDDFWNDYLQRNPSAVRFRHQKLPHCRELDYIFGRITPIGDFEWAPDSDVARIEDQAQQQSSSDIGIMAQSTPLHVTTPTPQGMKRRRISDVWKIENMLERLVESVESKSITSCTLVDSEGADKVYSIKDCIDHLNQMSDVEIGSELYLDALDIFKKKSNREFFVSIPPEVRRSWLQRQTRTPQS